jgi:hypothetical protein
LVKFLPFEKTFIFIGYTITSWQNLSHFLAKPQSFSKINIFFWLKFHLSTKPFYLLVKPPPFGKTNIFSYLNINILTKLISFLG